MIHAGVRPRFPLLAVLTLVAVVALAGAFPPAFAQSAPTYKVGDSVEVDPQLTHQWSQGTVTSVTILMGKVYGYVVRVDSGPAGAGNVLRLSPAHFRPSATPAPQAAANGQYRVGDTVEADFFGTGHWIQGRISQVGPTQGQYVVEDASTPGAHGAVNPLPASSIRPWPGGTTGQPAQTGPSRAVGWTPPPTPTTPQAAQNTVPRIPQTAPQQPGQFKTGDRVLTSINSATGDYQPCTIMGPLFQGTYPVRCDPYKGRPYTDWGAFPQFIKPWPGATAAPKLEACNYNVPGGTVTRNSPPTAQTFQRVIYDMASVAKEGQWGMTFTKFQIGTPYKNGVIQNGMGGVEMERHQAPQGTAIYPITSEYIRCLDVDTAYNERTVVDVNWACMKNNDGDWDCPTNSTAQIIKRERVPK